MQDSPSPVNLRRRRLLLSLASGASLPLVPACSGAFEREAMTVVAGDEGLPEAPPVAVALSSLVEGQRTNVTWGALEVELQREGTTVLARALLCTHQGCRLRWDASASVYRCACHEGQFDASGMPISSPPQRPMFRVPLLVSSTTVHVGGRPRG